MSDLAEMIKKRQAEFAEADRIRDAMLRPDADFIAWRRRDGRIGSIMRPHRVPTWAWRLLEIAARAVTRRL